MSTQAPIKVGLMGYGSSTKIFHLPYVLPNPDLRVVAFLQRAAAPSEADKANTEPGKHCTIDYPESRHHRTVESFVGDKEIEVVVVCTSSATHFEMGVSWSILANWTCGGKVWLDWIG